MEGRPPRRQALRPLQVQADAPFLICMGEVTKEEKEHLIKIGHGYEDSQTGEFFDISTMNESAFLDALENIDTSITEQGETVEEEHGTEESATNNGTFEILDATTAGAELNATNNGNNDGTFEIQNTTTNETFEILETTEEEEASNQNNGTFEVTTSSEEEIKQNNNDTFEVDNGKAGEGEVAQNDTYEIVNESQEENEKEGEVFEDSLKTGEEGKEAANQSLNYLNSLEGEETIENELGEESFIPETQPLFAVDDDEVDETETELPAIKMPEIPPVNVEEFQAQEPISHHDLIEESILEDKENMSPPGRKEYEDQDTTHFFEEESIIAANNTMNMEDQDKTRFFEEESIVVADKSMNVEHNPLDDTQEATSMQRMFATPAAAKTPVTASNHKVLRRSLRIALQKHNAGEMLNNQSMSESNPGTPLQRKSTRSTTRKSNAAAALNTTISSPMNLFIDSVRTPCPKTPGTLSSLAEEDTNKGKDLEAKANNENAPPTGVTGQEVDDEVGKTPKKKISSVATPRKLNNARTNANTTISSPMGLFIDSVKTPGQSPAEKNKIMSCTPAATPSKTQQQEEELAFQTPKVPKKKMASYLDGNESISSPMNLFIESVQTPKMPTKIARSHLDGNESISSPMNLFIESVQTPKKSVLRSASKLNSSTSKIPRKSISSSEEAKTPEKAPATPAAATPVSVAPEKPPRLNLRSTRNSMANKSLSSPLGLFIDSVKTPAAKSVANNNNKGGGNSSTNSTPGNKSTRKSLLGTPVSTVSSKAATPAKSPAATKLETPKKKISVGAFQQLLANTSVSSPMTLFTETVKTPAKTPATPAGKTPEAIEEEEDVNNESPNVIPETPVQAAPAAAPAAPSPSPAGRASGKKHLILPFYSPSVIKSLTGSPFVKQPLPALIREKTENVFRGTPRKARASEKASPCLINFDASVHLGEGHDSSALSSASADIFSASALAHKNPNDSVDLIKLDESRMLSSSGNNTTATSSVFELSQIDSNNADLTTDSAGTHDDTIELMDRLLAMADEQEKNEQDSEAKQLNNFGQSSNTAAIPESPKVPPSSPLSNASPSTCATPPKSTHKTPLTTMTRPPSALSSKRVIDLQKKKFFFTPSPLKSKAGATTTLNRTSFSASRLSSSGQNGKSSPALLASNASMKRRKSFIDIKARVDSNLNGKSPAGVGVVTLGLTSKVADYIYSTAPPSQFQRVIGAAAAVTPKSGPSSGIKKKPFVVGRATGIPRPSLPFLNSKVPAPNVGRPMPKSASRICPTSNIPTGSVKIGATSSGTPSRTFKQVNYVAASKLKTPNDVSFHENSRLKTYTGLRHTGNRDESGNASIIQNVSVNKAFLGSRLATPKSYANKKY